MSIDSVENTAWRIEMITRQGVDSKALLVTLIRRLPQLFMLAALGAALGGALNLIVALCEAKNAPFVAETKYYIDFAAGRLEAKDYYNDYTWNDVIGTDLILGRMMDRLGTGYDRAEVKNMLNADILSDVRYLTITVSDKDRNKADEVSQAFCSVIGEFAKNMDEFDDIYKIEDNGIEKERPKYFAWRAALLGMLVFLGGGVFFSAFGFIAGDCFYTKTDVIKFLGVNPLGFICKGGGKGLRAYDGKLIENLNELFSGSKKIYLLDAADGADAGIFMERLKALGADIDLSAFGVCDRYCVEDAAAIVAVVPFGRAYREKITDEINNALMHGAEISGAVLTECDRRWVEMYYCEI